MVKKLIGLLFAAAVIAVIVFVIAHRDNFTTMIEFDKTADQPVAAPVAVPLAVHDEPARDDGPAHGQPAMPADSLVRPDSLAAEVGEAVVPDAR